MIQVTPQTRVLVATGPVDFRKGIDGLARLCRSALAEDPFSGGVFVFCNRRRTAVKILAYDGQGFWICQKRLSRGRFPFWPGGDTAGHMLESYQLAVLLSGGDPGRARGLEPWRKIH